ncbi:antibiotic biosynthesis monooxygenase [Mycolicibacterium cosmeticum]|uniref:Antibiotic biosynthesis monooxygenase n=1 Tax=Mycolicibacterium cosmeticum TaxID=258533 RepID=W9AT70_MYCCO|nr:putative quinol monooxygenase [Mycolicibacterium cosmeticum]TLH72503.1 antibiotic biosynthesis monooxygenase [Mycolicibacterium cosmeticum]CDO05811.1 antibiotic biosynthesis monooxygenase [Mycolicibacterium cosmeticum]
MIFIVVKFDVAPQRRDEWLSTTADFTAATRAEPGNLWFEWSRSVADDAEYVLVEAFRDQQSGIEHVRSQHFRDGLAAMRPLLARTPRIINVEVDGDDWSEMGELRIE